MAVPVSAHRSNAKYGDVPKTGEAIILDGIKDPIYEQGLYVPVRTQYDGTSSRYGAAGGGEAWLLWDDGRFYAFFEIVTDAPLEASDDDEVIRNRPWEMDGVEVFFDFSNEATGDTANVFMMTNSGVRAFECKPTGTMSWHGRGDSPDGWFEAAVVHTDVGYNVEMVIQAADFSGEFRAGNDIGFVLQLSAGGATYHSDSGGWHWDPEAWAYLVLSDTVVTIPVEEEAPATTDGGTTTEAAPRTADPITLVVLGSLLSAAGITIAKKKYK
jgi:hypothetical protein